MEIRANYVLIGVFSIACVFAAFLFVLLLAKQQFDLEYSYYEILFDGDVSGLSVGAEVRYNGISVGEVRTIKLHPEDPGKVSVVIQVSADTPVREDSVAYLEAQLLTGVSIVQISGGSPESPALVAKPGQQYAVIQSGKSGLQELFTGAPDLIAKANILIERLADIVDTENRETITKTLKNVEVLTSAFANNSEELEAMLKNLSAASEDIASLVEQLDALAKTANDLLDEDEEDEEHGTHDAEENVQYRFHVQGPFARRRPVSSVGQYPLIARDLAALMDSSRLESEVFTFR